MSEQRARHGPYFVSFGSIKITYREEVEDKLHLFTDTSSSGKEVVAKF